MLAPASFTPRSLTCIRGLVSKQATELFDAVQNADGGWFEL